MPTTDIVFVVILCVAMFASYTTNKLTLAGTLTGGLVAVCIYTGAGYTGLSMLGAFFVLSVLATGFGKRQKASMADSQKHQQKRDTWQVLANGGAAAILGISMRLFPVYSPLIVILMAASLASATADTLSSELGTVFGKRFYNIVTFKPDEKGRDGVVSLEGTLIGILASFFIALLFAAGFGFGAPFWFIIIGGTAGNVTDSLLGATLERKTYLNNNAVNFVNTAVAAAVCFLLMQF